MSDDAAMASKGHVVYPRWFVWFLRFILTVSIAGAGFKTYHWLVENAPVRERRPTGERSVVVEVTPLRHESKKITIRVTGTVIPVHDLSLKSRVNGEVVAIHPELEPGGRLTSGAVTVRLDTADYTLDLLKAQAALQDVKEQIKENAIREANLQESLKLSEKSVELADAELRRLSALRLSQTVSASAYDAQERAVLTLRSQAQTVRSALRLIPTERTVLQAQLDQVQAQVGRAKLDLERTEIVSPFDAAVLFRSVSLGTLVTPQTELARLVDIEAFWVETPLRADQLDWIALPNGDSGVGASAIIRPSGVHAEDTRWTGTVVRRQVRIEEQGRLARLLIRVERPFDSEKIPLLLGSFVLVEIDGPLLEDVFIIPRTAIHNGQEVWLRTADGRLEIRTVESIWSDEEVVLFQEGLKEGEQLVLTDIASLVPGMKLDLPGDEPSQPERVNPAKNPGSGKGRQGQ